MSKKYQITNPCTKLQLKSIGDGENFHCKACNKNVKDLDTFRLNQLSDNIDREKNTCVKVSSNKLNVINYLRSKSKSAALASMITLMSTSCNKRVQQSFDKDDARISINGENSKLQNNQIAGKILEYGTNDPLIFTIVYIKNTKIGVESDFDGQFILSIPVNVEDSAIVRFSFIGYKTIEIELGKVRGKDIIVHMEENTDDDAIIIGYLEVIE